MDAVEKLEKLLVKRARLDNTRNRIERALALVLYTQYYNALRISEAIECIYYFLRSNVTEIVIQARKRGNLRMCYIPPELTNETDKLILKEYYARHGWDLDRIKFAIANLAKLRGIRTHDFRKHAIWTLFAEEELPASDIAILTGHRKIKTIYEYYINPFYRNYMG